MRRRPHHSCTSVASFEEVARAGQRRRRLEIVVPKVFIQATATPRTKRTGLAERRDGHRRAVGTGRRPRV